MTMELDDIKQAWQQLDRRLAAIEDDGARRTVHDHLRALRVGQWALVGMGIGLAWVAGSFWFDHRHNAAMLASGLFLHAYALVFVVAGARNLYLQSRIDYAAPVLAIQASLARLRHWRAMWEGWVFGVANCLAWVPMLVMLFAYAGVDIWARSPLTVVAWLCAAGACLGVFIGVQRWSQSNPRVRRVLDCNTIGAGLRRAGATLDELERFARD
jgi:hypothetical protein